MQLPRDEEFRAKEKKFHKMTRDGLVERGAASGEETRISGREQDFDLRQARDSPDSLEDLSVKARHTRQQRPKNGDAPQIEPVEDADASPLEDLQTEAHEDAPREEPREKSGNRRTRYQQKFSESSSASEAATEQPRTSKLQFAEDELPPDAPGKKLVKARQKAERTARKLEQAEGNLPARRKLRLEVEPDAATGNAKRRLKFEKEVISQQEHIKGAKPLRPVKKGANAAIGYAHKKIYENEHENVGIEAAHRTELVAEGGLRALNPAAEKDGENPRKGGLPAGPSRQPQAAEQCVFPHVAEAPLKKGVCQSCQDRPAHRAGCRENGRCHEKSRRRGWAFCQPPPGPLPDGGAPVFDRCPDFFPLFFLFQHRDRRGRRDCSVQLYRGRSGHQQCRAGLYGVGNRPADTD